MDISPKTEPLVSDDSKIYDLEIDDEKEIFITIISSDNIEFTVNKYTLDMSDFIKNTLLNDRDAKLLELNVISSTLELIFEYMRYHTTEGRKPNMIKPIIKPLRSLDMKILVDDKFDAEFALKLTNKQKASNYLQVDPLLNLLCARVATLIKNKSHDEIRKIFIPNSDAVETMKEEKLN